MANDTIIVNGQTVVSPRAEVVFYGAVRLARKGDEATAARFTVDRASRVGNVNTLAKQLVERL